MNVFKKIGNLIKKAALKIVDSENFINWLKSDNGIVTMLVAIAAAVLWYIFGSDSDIMAASGVIIAGTAGGKHVVDGPLTTSLSEEASPGLLRNEIDSRIVKIRPMSTPLDQISRWGGSRACGSMIVDYYSVDTKPTRSEVAEGYDNENGDGETPARIVVSDAMIFEPTETVLVPSIKGVDAKGGSTGMLVLYVVSRESANVINVLPVNNFSGDGKKLMPSLSMGTKLIRMGRAAAELDVQTAQFEALPQKAQNYCQIFKAQVEQSTFKKIANKEVGWDFSDQEEVAIIDMRLGMEKNFLFGVKSRLYDPEKRNEVLLTGGIWEQTDREMTYAKGKFTPANLVDLTRMAFTQNAGSAQKILIGGTGLIEALNKMDLTRVAGPADKMTKWGISFSEICTKFGTLHVIASEVFDECGHENDGMVIDPDYITKYCHVPFRTEKLDLRKSGIRNCDAIVITEASCLVLRYPQTHMRVVAV